MPSPSVNVTLATTAPPMPQAADPMLAQPMNLLPSALTGLGPAVRSCLVWGAGGAPPPAADDPAWERDAEVIVGAKLAAVALAAMADAGGRPNAEVHGRFRSSAVAWALRTMATEAACASALRGLAEEAVPFVVVKGPAVARFHPAPDTRPYLDVDVVVPPASYRRVVERLGDAGFRREPGHIQPWPWFETVCVEGANFHGDGGGNLDVHHHLAPWVFATRISATDLLERAEPGAIGGVPVQMASAEDSLVVACLHVLNDLWKADASLLTWRDLCCLRHQLGADGSRAALARGGLEWFAPIVEAAHRSLVDGVDAAGAAHGGDGHQPWGRRTRLRLLGWGGPTTSARHSAGWALRLPFGRAACFVAGGLVPSRRYVHDLYGGYGAYWRQLLSTLRAAARGRDTRWDPVPGPPTTRSPG